MKLLIIAAASLAVVSCASLSLEDLEFHAWKLKFGKSYRTPEEEAQRKDIWLSTHRTVLTHNILADQGIKTFRMGMNHFSDMDIEEFKENVLLRNMIPSNKTRTLPHRGTKPSTPKGGAVKLPDYVDWRESGCVSSVKKQGKCKSCWAFSATGALESHYCIKYYENLFDLSEQQLVDCSWSYGNKGCSGGRMDSAFQYIIDNGGIDIEDYYPYEGKDGSCRFDPGAVAVTCTGYTDLPPADEEVLQVYVDLKGPVSVAVDASNFQNYGSGVFYDSTCSSKNVTHAVLVVGYGTEEGQDYWLVKNSWGEDWGEEGYIKMSRNKNNQCGIASYASFPIIE